MIYTDNNLLDILGACNDVSPIKSLPKQGTKELRKETRYKVAWKIVVAVEGQDLHNGRIMDISQHGAAILNGFNIKPGTSVTLNIHIPTLTTPCTQKVLVVHGTTSFTVHDAEHRCFRVGITFTKFDSATGMAYLEERLTNHHFKVLEYC